MRKSLGHEMTSDAALPPQITSASHDAVDERRGERPTSREGWSNLADLGKRDAAAPITTLEQERTDEPQKS
jgi:hypothetical protein